MFHFQYGTSCQVWERICWFFFLTCSDLEVQNIWHKRHHLDKEVLLRRNSWTSYTPNIYIYIYKDFLGYLKQFSSSDTGGIICLLRMATNQSEIPSLSNCGQSHLILPSCDALSILSVSCASMSERGTERIAALLLEFTVKKSNGELWNVELLTLCLPSHWSQSCCLSLKMQKKHIFFEESESTLRCS